MSDVTREQIDNVLGEAIDSAIDEMRRQSDGWPTKQMAKEARGKGIFSAREAAMALLAAHERAAASDDAGRSCVICGNPVDTRDNGTDGAQLRSGAWVCSDACWDAVNAQADALDDARAEAARLAARCEALEAAIHEQLESSPNMPFTWTQAEALRAALAPADAPASGVTLIANERERQKSVEGWTPEHDDEHDNGELARAAAIYAAPEYATDSAGRQRRHTDSDTRSPVGFEAGTPYPPAGWPWNPSWWKPKDRLRNLTRAGALIAAEIDRLLRKAKRADAPASERAVCEVCGGTGKVATIWTSRDRPKIECPDCHGTGRA